MVFHRFSPDDWKMEPDGRQSSWNPALKSAMGTMAATVSRD
jgi:hypothetical protein